MDAHGGGQRREDFVFDALGECRIHCLFLDGDLLLADRLGEVVDHRDDLLDRGVGGFERLDDLLFAHFLRAGFDHDEAVLAAGDDQIELALLALGEGRVDEVLAVNQADPHAGDGLLERDVGQGERRRGPGEGEDVGVVLAVGGEHERDDLRLEAPPGRKQRANRAVDDAARQDFLLRRLAFTLEEAAGDSP